MTVIAQRQFDFSHWTESNVHAWLTALDYNRLLDEPVCAPGLPVVERFDWHGRPVDPGFRRVRVMARQAYVLCHAAIGDAETHRLASVAVGAIVRSGLGSDGQFHCRLASDGSVIEAAPDLYDIAFGLFAMAWWYRLTRDEQAITIAEQSVRHLRETLAGPTGQGFRARAGETGLLEQNPHMHLFEAATFLAAFTKRPVFRELADDLFALAEDVLFDPGTSTLPEFFDWSGTPVDKHGARDGSVTIEPGHHYEWAWLLHRYARLARQPRAYDMADALFAFALRHGHDPRTGLVFDAVDRMGRPTGQDLRIWPNLEMLKAQVAMQERHGSGPGFDDAAMLANVQRIRSHFLTRQADGPAAALREGWWIDYLDGRSLTPKSDHVPASTLYHIFFAFTELLRHRAGHDPFSGLPW